METLAKKVEDIRSKFANLAAIRDEIAQLASKAVELDAEYRKALAVSVFNASKAPTIPRELSATRTRLAELEQALPTAERMLADLAEGVKAESLKAFAETENTLQLAYETALADANDGMLAAMTQKARVSEVEGAALSSFKVRAQSLLSANNPADIVEAIAGLLPVETAANV